MENQSGQGKTALWTRAGTSMESAKQIAPSSSDQSLKIAHRPAIKVIDLNPLEHLIVPCLAFNLRHVDCAVDRARKCDVGNPRLMIKS